jgi:hypothetical protein
VGLPVRLLLTPGQAADKTTLPELIAGLRPAREATADRGYSARSIIELFATRGTTAHIPSQSNVRDRPAVSSNPFVLIMLEA